MITSGTAHLFAALDTLDGVCPRPVRAAPYPSGIHRFLDAVERAAPADKRSTPSSTTTPLMSIPRSKLARPPSALGVPFHPDSGSWLDADENFFAALTRRRLRRGVFRSIADLQAAINRYLEAHNDDPKPFVWTKPADAILAKLSRLPVPSV